MILNMERFINWLGPPALQMTSGGNWPNNQPRTMILPPFVSPALLQSILELETDLDGKSPFRYYSKTLPAMYCSPWRKQTDSIKPSAPRPFFCSSSRTSNFLNSSTAFLFYSSFIFPLYFPLHLNAAPPAPLLGTEIVPASGPL